MAAKPSKRDERAKFAKRLQEACDDDATVPKDSGSRSQRRQVLAARWGISREMVRKYLKGENMPVTSRGNIIADDLGVRRAWLMHGEPPKRLPPAARSDGRSGDNFEPQPSTVGRLPVVDWEQVGRMGAAVPEDLRGGVKEWRQKPVDSLSAHSFVIRVRGSSMEPRFPEGHLIFVDPHRAPNHGSYVVAQIQSSKLPTFKQLLIEDGKRMLKAINPAWPEPIIVLDAADRIIGVVGFHGETL